MRLLITGGHGFVGRYAVRELLRRCPDAELTLLVRPRGDEAASARVRRALSSVGVGDAAVRIEEGNLGEPRMGLDRRRYEALAGRIDRVLHAAANVRFDQDLEGARRANLASTARILRFGVRAGIERLDHVSTCFVAGRRQDRVLETDLLHDRGFRNPYEESKYDTERLLREPRSMRELQGDPLEDLPYPVTVLRPSMVVGESTTGRTASFHMIYWPLKLYARGYWRTLIGYPETPIDAVPVDYVGNAMAEILCCEEAAGATYHLAAGPERQTTIGELAGLAAAILEAPPVRYMDPDFFMRWLRPLVDPMLMLTRRGRSILKGGRLYLPYFAGNPRFDTARADALLAPRGIRPPHVRDMFEPLLRYAVTSDFGRRKSA